MEGSKSSYWPVIKFFGLRIAAVALIAVTLICFVFGWPFKKTPADHIGISYGGGLVEGAQFQRIVEPGTGRFINGFFDKLYLYPTTQRNYIVSSREGEGDIAAADSITAPSQDNIATTFEVATYFKLNTDRLQQFHENIGFKYAGWTDEGWDRLLNDSFRQQIESALQREARKYPVAALYSDDETLVRIQDSIGTVLKDNVADVLGSDYFCGPTFVPGNDECPDFEFIVKRVTVPNEVQVAFENVRTSEIGIQTRRNEVEQARLQAQAIRELTQNESLTPQYVDLKYVEMLQQAIKSGTIQFWVLNGQGVNVGGPRPTPAQ